MRGEKSANEPINRRSGGSPPLARGKEIVTPLLKILLRITPACAGKRMWTNPIMVGYWDHPRLRGEKFLSHRHVFLRAGSPPLARGKAASPESYSEPTRITPACAGKRHDNATVSNLSGDHPRLRGEKSAEIIASVRRAGSPPLARGKVRFICKRRYFAGITPACAGKSKR